MTDKSQPLSGAAPAPTKFKWECLFCHNRIATDADLIEEDYNCPTAGCGAFAWYLVPPAAPVAVPAGPRFPLGDVTGTIGADNVAAPAPLPPPQEPTPCEHEFEEVCIRCGKSIFDHIKEQQ